MIIWTHIGLWGISIYVAMMAGIVLASGFLGYFIRSNVDIFLKPHPLIERGHLNGKR